MPRTMIELLAEQASPDFPGYHTASKLEVDAIWKRLVETGVEIVDTSHIPTRCVEAMSAGPEWHILRDPQPSILH